MTTSPSSSPVSPSPLTPDDLLPLVADVVRRRNYHLAGWTADDFVNTGVVALLEAFHRGTLDGLTVDEVRSRAEWEIRSAISAAIRDELRRIADQPTQPLPVLSLTAAGSTSTSAVANYNVQITPAWIQDRITRKLEALPSREPSVEEQVVVRLDGMAVSETLAEALERLTTRQRFVVARRFGLLATGGDDVWTCTRLAEELGVSERTIYRIQAQALTRLRMLLAQTADGGLTLRTLEARKRQQRRRAGNHRAA